MKERKQSEIRELDRAHAALQGFLSFHLDKDRNILLRLLRSDALLVEAVWDPLQTPPDYSLAETIESGWPAIPFFELVFIFPDDRAKHQRRRWRKRVTAGFFNIRFRPEGLKAIPSQIRRKRHWDRPAPWQILGAINEIYGESWLVRAALLWMDEHGAEHTKPANDPDGLARRLIADFREKSRSA